MSVIMIIYISTEYASMIKIWYLRSHAWSLSKTMEGNF